MTCVNEASKIDECVFPMMSDDTTSSSVYSETLDNRRRSGRSLHRVVICIDRRCPFQFDEYIHDRTVGYQYPVCNTMQATI